MTKSAIAMLVFASAALGQGATVAQAGKSPHDFAKYIGSGSYEDCSRSDKFTPCAFAPVREK